jgi:hypothetical protein
MKSAARGDSSAAPRTAAESASVNDVASSIARIDISSSDASRGIDAAD